jgi:alanine racemase
MAELGMIPRVTATIDLAAIRHNLGVVRRLAPASKVMAAIKADGYGHGAVAVARALDAESFAVACLEEALILREAGISKPIALLEGILSAEEARIAVQQQLQVVVHDHWQLRLLDALGARPLSVWLKLDSGMHRLGFPLCEVRDLYEYLQARPHWRFCGWITHLACADEIDKTFTTRQITAFEQALGDLPGARSIANSAGLIAWPKARVAWVRPGLMLYGASPLPDQSAAALGLKPAMNVESRLIAVREYAAGEGIGYGQTWHCPERMKIGVVAIGYADGVHRSLPSGSPLLILGRRVPLVGRVSMDMITVDLREVPQAQVGDPVRLWGEGLPVEEIAACAGTLAYELMCGLTHRVQLVY